MGNFALFYLNARLKALAATADNNPMGELIEFPNCKSISPEAHQRITRRTEKSSYWVRRWSEIYRSLCDDECRYADELLLEDASFYLDGWLQDRNREAIKARGF